MSKRFIAKIIATIVNFAVLIAAWKMFSFEGAVLFGLSNILTNQFLSDTN